MEVLRKGCLSCRASGPDARAMGMARCFPAELHSESEGTGPGLREGVPSCQGSWGRGRGEKEIRQNSGWHSSRGRGSMADGRGSHLGTLSRK